jgi:CheY-like chemotaxis protein
MSRMFRKRPEEPEDQARTVLLVEDQTPVRALLVTTLARQGYHVLAAHDGPDALVKAADYEGPIDLLLTDMVMPNMSGSVLCERLSQIRPEMRVLYTSGHADRATQLELGRQALTVGGVKGLEPDDFFLAKPFGVTELVKKVEALLEQPPGALAPRILPPAELERPSFAGLRRPL